MATASPPRRPKWARSPWISSIWTLLVTFLAFVLVLATVRSFLTRQRDPKGCSMSWMRPAFALFPDFGQKHTRLSKRYSLYLYREALIDEDPRVKGVPVLFISGNAGSYKQVRPLAAQAAIHYRDHLQNDQQAVLNGKATLDFFAVDFNEDFSALHGRTLLDQAEYVNDAIAYILGLYNNTQRSIRDSSLPDPASVILVGHSMGGIVARTAMTLSNYQVESVNTILTLATPHARAPISFDKDIMDTYQQINDYWRFAYSHRLESKNPLWETTVVSIAGGSLDTIVPSDYSTLASIVPPSHGFTVFTSSIPQVWTSMDHLAITWCNQLREVVIKSLYDIIDARDTTQTISREGRMRALRKNLLTGLESFGDNTPNTDMTTLLKTDADSSRYFQHGARLVLGNRGDHEGHRWTAHLMPIPTERSENLDVFRVLTNRQINSSSGFEKSGVFFCNELPQEPSESGETWLSVVNLADSEDQSQRLSCMNAMSDATLLPSSYFWNRLPVDHYLTDDWNKLVHHNPPFSYLQYDLETLDGFQYFVIVDMGPESSRDWFITEFAHQTDHSSQTMAPSTSLLEASFPAKSMLNEIRMPSIYSSLLSYHVKIRKEACSKSRELFRPILRQHISEPYESKFFVNVEDASISMHGVAPYIPISLGSKNSPQGLLLQIWADPVCSNPLNITLRVDYFGSLGKLWMRYRTVFAAFPILIVALVLRKQFALYDKTGTFVSFSEGLDLSLRRSIPVTLAVLTLLGLALSKATGFGITLVRLGYAPESFVDFTRTDLLLGLQDPFFWFLVPVFGIISVGVCVVVNYASLSLTLCFALVSSLLANRIRKRTNSGSKSNQAALSLQSKLVILAILLLLVFTIIPHQLVYLLLCMLQMTTCVRAMKLARETHSLNYVHFYNYAHAILILMTWILPINGPILIVLIHNLQVYGLTPFTSHHNIFSIMPFIFLVEIISRGKLPPQLSNSPARHITSLLFLLFGAYSAVFGVSYAYRLHDIANVICIWLAAIYLSANDRGVEGLNRIISDFRGGRLLSQQHLKKTRDIH